MGDWGQLTRVMCVKKWCLSGSRKCGRSEEKQGNEINEKAVGDLWVESELEVESVDVRLLLIPVRVLGCRRNPCVSETMRANLGETETVSRNLINSVLGGEQLCVLERVRSRRLKLDRSSQNNIAWSPTSRLHAFSSATTAATPPNAGYPRVSE